MTKLVVKLNGRHSLYKVLRMTHAWRFTDYSKNAKDIQEIESFLRDRFGNQEWGWRYAARHSREFKNKWATHWSDPKRNRPRIYWIGVKDPEIIMMAGLCGLKT